MINNSSQVIPIVEGDIAITDVTIELLEAEKANLLGQLEKESKR